jgi:hypothetical protein
VGPTASLDHLERDKHLDPVGIRTPYLPARSLITVLTTLSWRLCIVIGILVKQRLFKQQGFKRLV